MFEQRLKILLGVFGFGLLLIVMRLVQLQVVRADYYRQKASSVLLRPPSALRFVRGRILDRTGEVLVRQEPSWDVTVDYVVLAADTGDDHAQKALLNRYTWANDTTGLEHVAPDRVMRRALNRMWSDIALFAAAHEPLSVEELRSRAIDIYNRVQRIRSAVALRRGFAAPVAEENTSHPILSGLSSDRQVKAREVFAQYPWVHVVASSVRRVLGEAEPMAHVLGRLGRVDASVVANDPNAQDKFGRYRANESVGISGVEYAAESILRGRRGQITRDRDGQVVADGLIEAQDGEDAVLTIHAELQRRLYRLLGETVSGIPDSPGGSIVVLDVATREVLALVSYPSFDPVDFRPLYSVLRDETDTLPLRFRAVSNQYAPGSIIKPLTCLQGLLSGVITLNDRENCTGYLFPDVRDAWRCWRIHGTNQRKAHGDVDVTGALRESCNVFMYRVGERIGVDALCSAYDMVGLGYASGTGLREEARGVNPTPSWLMNHKNMRPTPGTARQFAIGQGELLMTPIQAANLMATYASGRFQRVTLIQGKPSPPQLEIPGSPEQWHAIRQGIYGVVNDPQGTAYRTARLQDERFALCGKTGSATAYRWPTSYRIPYTDAAGGKSWATIRAGAQRPAIKRFVRENPDTIIDRDGVRIASKWPPHPPPEGDRYSHAWFGGFLQPLLKNAQPDWSREAPYAFAVLVEFGGSGGRTSGPLARSVSEQLIALFESEEPRG